MDIGLRAEPREFLYMLIVVLCVAASYGSPLNRNNWYQNRGWCVLAMRKIVASSLWSVVDGFGRMCVRELFPLKEYWGSGIIFIGNVICLAENHKGPTRKLDRQVWLFSQIGNPLVQGVQV